MGDIEFTECEIREVWKDVFKADAPESMTTTEVFEACLSELGGTYLRDALRCLQTDI